MVSSGIPFGYATVQTLTKGKVEKGKIDLSIEDLKKEQSISLEGDWLFFWNELLPPKNEKIEKSLRDSHLIKIPGAWRAGKDKNLKNFKDYGYSDLLRNFVGVAKTSTSTLLILGLWYNEITIYASLSMAFFMLCAQLSHIKVKNPFIKFVPSLIFLIMSLFIASFNCGLI